MEPRVKEIVPQLNTEFQIMLMIINWLFKVQNESEVRAQRWNYHKVTTVMQPTTQTRDRMHQNLCVFPQLHPPNIASIFTFNSRY